MLTKCSRKCLNGFQTLFRNTKLKSYFDNSDKILQPQNIGNKETQKPWPEQTSHKAEHKLKHNPQPTIYTLKHFATPNTIAHYKSVKNYKS